MKYLLSLTIAGLVLLSFSAEVRAQGRSHRLASFQSLERPPGDTAEARRLRIWLGIDRTSSCRVNVDIADSSGTVVRHLVSRLMRKGYYNIYWDKRNDSGQYVPAGYYVVNIDDCGDTSSVGVEAVYRPYENLTELAVDESQTPAGITLGLVTAADKIDLKIFTVDSSEIATVVSDTSLPRGEHVIPMNVDNSISRGRYRLRLYINEGFVRETEFTYSD